MPIPAHMWLKDDGGADIKGSSTVQDREGNIEIISFGHGVNLPVDGANGKITGKRTHSPIAFEKEFDAATPYLYKAVAKGKPCNRPRSSGIASTMREERKSIS